MADLYLMVGCPGSGKSTFLKNRISKLDDKCKIISRDEIRFSIVQPNEKYFSHEKEVVQKFWDEVNKNLSLGKTVFVDQTSLTKKSRAWLLEHVHGYNHAYVIWINESLYNCLKRNENRKGTRAYVPQDQIRRMFNRFEEPTKSEGFDYIFKYKGE